VVLDLERVKAGFVEIHKVDSTGTGVRGHDLLRRRGVGFRSLHESLDTTTPGGRLVFHVFAALAEFIRELIVAGTHEGLAAARARGQRLGRPPALSADQIRQARALLERPEESVSSIARLLGVSRSTLYRHLPELAVTSRPALPEASGAGVDA
jgi:DNA invertase Pin-like site-specific DNA recombinase